MLISYQIRGVGNTLFSLGSSGDMGAFIFSFSRRCFGLGSHSGRGRLGQVSYTLLPSTQSLAQTLQLGA